MRLPFALLLIAKRGLAGRERRLSPRRCPRKATLQGARASQQFLAIAKYSDGVGARRHRGSGVASLRTGSGEIHLPGAGSRRWRTADLADGSLSAAVRPHPHFNIEDATATQPVSFPREIAGILTKRGCNSAICHGGVKGQGGFKLSANALYPADDYDWITKGGVYQVLTAEVKGERIPRIDLAEPGEEPAASEAHHGRCRTAGGKRFETDSEDYQTILGWIRKRRSL